MSQITATPRITTARARELLAGATPGPWQAFDDGADDEPDEGDDPQWTIAKSRSGHTTRGVIAGEVLDMRGEDARLIAAAPDLAADLIAARAERDDARRMLGECYVISGADTDGNGWERLWRHAVENAHETRRLHDASTDELLAQVDGLRTEIAALRAAKTVTVEEHARAVRNMLIGAEAAYRAASGCGRIEAKRVIAAGWKTSLDRSDLLATLTRRVGAERAAALVDGGA